MATRRFAPSWYKQPAPSTQVPRFGPSWARTVTPGYVAPAAAPASGAAPGGAGGGGTVPSPPDATYEAAQQRLSKQRELTLGALAQSRSSGLSDYGFTEGSYDPNATGFGSLTVDPNNPRSKAALLKASYDTSRRATGQQMGSAGQLYAGAFQNRRDLINREQIGAEDTLQKSLARFLAQNTQQWGQAGFDYTTGLSQAAAERADRAAQSPLYEPTPEAPEAAPVAAAAGPGFTSQPYTSPSGAKGVLHIYPDGRRVFVKK